MPRSRSRSRSRSRASIALAPILALASVLGCPKKSDPTDAGPVSSASTPAPSSSLATKASADPIPSASASDDALDASIDLDASTGDATLVDGDALSDAIDARSRDAADDAPLMGTKTFFDENPVKGIRKITSNAAKVHKAPKDGAAITSLPKGTEVSLVAELYDWYRVRYTDPATNIRRQGWIYIINFVGPRQKTCPIGWTHHPQDGGWCDRECTKNTDCKALKGYKCSGSLCFYAGD